MHAQIEEELFYPARAKFTAKKADLVEAAENITVKADAQIPAAARCANSTPKHSAQ